MNDFLIYNKNRSTFLDIVDHSETSENALNKFIDTFQDRDSDLDLLHLILKHARSCPLDTCFIQSRYIDIFPLVTTRALNTHDITYSLLVCMIDLLKNDVSLLSNATLQSFLRIGCSLWTHTKIYLCRKSMELCTLVVPIASSYDMVLDAIIQYIQVCRKYIQKQDIQRFQSIEYTEFFHYSVDKFTFDRVTLKRLIELILMTCLKQDLNIHYITTIQKEISGLQSSEAKELLFTIYCVNDDDTIHLLDSVLSIYQQGQLQWIQLFQKLDITPHSLFLHFVQQCGNTHDILIDLLLENDSDFLAYFHRYIIYATHDITRFKDAVQDLDTVQTIIANLILVIDGDGFPYNTKPLVKRLIKFEEKLY